MGEIIEDLLTAVLAVSLGAALFLLGVWWYTRLARKGKLGPTLEHDDVRRTDLHK